MSHADLFDDEAGTSAPAGRTPLAERMRPLVLKDGADDIGMHESTISRVTANKYMYCPQGMLELKYFFNAGLFNDGATLGTIAAEIAVVYRNGKASFAEVAEANRMPATVTATSLPVAPMSWLFHRAEAESSSVSDKERLVAGR